MQVLKKEFYQNTTCSWRENDEGNGGHLWFLESPVLLCVVALGGGWESGPLGLPETPSDPSV